MGWRERLTDDEAAEVARLEREIAECNARRVELRAALKRISDRAAQRETRSKP